MAAIDYDVIVVGAGGAGLSAAAAASEAGAKVLIVESEPRTGGSTALSGGVFYAAGTSLQREAGVDDPGPDDQYRYYMTLNQYRLEAALVRRLCNDAPDAFEWLRALGCEFRVADLYAAGVDKIPRGHRAAGGGAAIVEAIEGSLDGVDIATATRVESLLIEDGAVRGIVTGGAPVRAAAVILATGGFGANPALLAELYPDAARHGDAHWYIGAPGSRGDGLVMGRDAGAGVDGLNKGLLLLSPGFAKDLESYLPGWLMHVTPAGRRFVDESIEYSVLVGLLRDQPGGVCFALFDEDRRTAARTSAYRPAPNWTADRLAEFAGKGLLARADTIPALAGMIGVPADALETAIARYNAMADAGADRDFFKSADLLHPIRTPPFYAATIRAAIVCWTGTGLRIDVEAHVLDEAGRAIPGLYAAGETTGGMFGDCYASGGASIANAVIFGRVAGRNAATDAAAITERTG